jgi:two-component system, cell cycle response regulator
MLVMEAPRILIVEDEAITVADLRRALTTLGYEITGTVDTAEEALKAAEQQQPDLVLMDITLAGELDGVAAAAALRGSADVPVVFLTAHADDRTLERAMLAGPFGYVLKPFVDQELKAAIEVALRKHRTESELKRR